MKRNEQQRLPAPEFSFGASEYAEVWGSLRSAIGESNYFNGTVTTHHPSGVTSRLTATLIIYRDRDRAECPITKIVPIWWELTTQRDEFPLLNDFSLRELLEHKSL